MPHINDPNNSTPTGLVIRDTTKNQIENVIYNLVWDLAQNRAVGIREQYDEFLGKQSSDPTGGYIIVDDNPIGRLRTVLDLYEQDFLR